MPAKFGKKEDLKKVIKLYKEFFKTHNIFIQKDKKILEHLKNQIKKNKLLILEDKKEIKAALFIVKKTESEDGKHKLYKFRHFAFKTESLGKELLHEAETYIRKDAETIKIEQTVAENEKGIDLYKKDGYEIEATLPNHYRWGETCHILGKSMR